MKQALFVSVSFFLRDILLFMKKIILASSSPRRKKMLQQLGLRFTVMPSSYQEKLNPRLKPKGQVAYLSQEKAEAVARTYLGEDAVIISADTLLTLHGETLGKPKSEEDAIRTLERLSGQKHSAVTAFTLYDTKTKKHVTKTAETILYMKKLSKKDIEQYVKTGEPMDRAGSYALDGRGAAFVSSLEGDYYTVIGFPLYLLVDELKRFGVIL